MRECGKHGIAARSHSPVKVLDEDEIVGEYFGDIRGDDRGIVQTQAEQVLNCVKATDSEAGLFLYCGPEPAITRRVFDTFRNEMSLYLCTSVSH